MLLECRLSATMNTPSHDVIVVGAGPAGLTAATEAVRAGLTVLCLDKLAPGGEIMNLGELHDFEELFDGTTMAARLVDDAIVAGVEIGFGEVVSASGTGPFEITTAEGAKHVGRALVIATGMSKGKLGVPGEAEFEGRGLSHCAHCDGPLYAGQSVIIAPPPAWAWTYTEAAALAGIAGDITVLDKPPSAPSAGVTVVNGHIVALEGNDGLEAVTIEAGGQRNTVPANAVFVYTGRAPAAEFMPDSLARDASRHIVVDEQGQTSLPLVYAAGDVRSGTKDYLRNAIADGQNVARSVVAALAK